MSNKKEKKQVVTFEIEERIGVLYQNQTGWSKELNLVSWNGKSARYDIREWSEDHTKMSKGITLHPQEVYKLYKLLSERAGK